MRNSSGDFFAPKPMTLPLKYSMAMNERKVMLYDDVDNDSVFEVIYLLNRMRYLDNKFDKEKKPIEIQICTDGGWVEDGFALISLIEEMKEEGYEIITTNIGKAYSMGFLISLVGTTRRSVKYGMYMYHDISYGAFGKRADVIDSVEHANRLSNYVTNIITKYTNLSKEDIEIYNKERKNLFMTPEELMGMKGVDYIV